MGGCFAQLLRRGADEVSAVLVGDFDESVDLGGDCVSTLYVEFCCYCYCSFSLFVLGGREMGVYGDQAVLTRNKLNVAALSHLVPSNRIGQTRITVRIQIVGPHKHLLLPGRHGERSHAGHDIADGLPRPELVDEAPVLGVEPAVPVDLGVVEAEAAVLLVDLNVQVGVAGEELVAEGAVFVLLADFVRLVDDGADDGVFVEEDGGDEVFVWEVLLAEVEVGLKLRYSISQLFSRSNALDFILSFCDSFC